MSGQSWIFSVDPFAYVLWQRESNEKKSIYDKGCDVIKNRGKRSKEVNEKKSIYNKGCDVIKKRNRKKIKLKIDGYA